MLNKLSKPALIAIVFIPVLIISLVLYILLNNDDVSYDFESNGYTATAQYVNNNTWQITVNGELPNPCYSTNFEIMGENTSNINVLFIVQNPNPEEICPQVIEEISLTEEFSAPRETTITFDSSIQEYEDQDIPVDDTTGENFKTLSSDGFTLSIEYTGNSTWEYEILGQLPNPCYTTEVDTIVLESFPEQVSITLIAQSSDEICAQVIAPVNLQGQISASDQANFNFNVERE